MDYLNKTLAFLAKLATCLILVIGFEGIITFGEALNWQDYGAIAWIIQACVLILCIRASSIGWFMEITR